MSIHATTPLIVTGPGGDYRTGWSESLTLSAPHLFQTEGG